MSLDGPVERFKLADDELVSAAMVNGNIAFGNFDKAQASYLSFPAAGKLLDWFASKRRIVVARENQQAIDVRYAPAAAKQFPVNNVQQIAWDASQKAAILATERGLFFAVEGKPIPLESPASGVVQQVAISANGEYASALYEGSKLVVWRLGGEPVVIQQLDNASAAAFGKDCMLIGKRTGEVLKLSGANFENSATQQSVQGRIATLVAAKQSRRILLVTESGALQILDGDGSNLRKPPAEMPAGPITSVCWSDDESFIAASQMNGNIVFWQLKNDKVQIIEANIKGPIGSLALQMLPAPVLALALNSGELVFLDLKSKTRLSQFVTDLKIIALNQLPGKIELMDQNGHLWELGVPRFYTVSTAGSIVTHVQGGGTADDVLIATSSGSLLQWSVDDAKPREIGNAKSPISNLVSHPNRPAWVITTHANETLFIDAKATLAKPLSLKPVATPKVLGFVEDAIAIEDGTNLRLWSIDSDREKQVPKEWPQKLQPQDFVLINPAMSKLEVFARGKTAIQEKPQTVGQKFTLGAVSAVHVNGGAMLVATGNQLHALSASNTKLAVDGLTASAERVSLAPNGDHFCVIDVQGKLWLGSVSANRIQAFNRTVAPRDRTVRWSSDSKTIAIQSDSNVNIVEHASGSVVATIAAPRPDSRILFFSDTAIGFLSKEGLVEQLQLALPANRTTDANETVLQILPLPDNRLGIATETQWKIFDLNSKQMDATAYPLLAKPLGVAFAEFTQTAYALLENGQVWVQSASQEPRLLRVEGQRPWKNIDVDAMGKLCLMTDGFGTSMLGKIQSDRIERGKVPVDLPVMLARFVDSKDLLVVAKDINKVFRVSINGTVLKQSKLHGITDANFFSDASRVAIANGEAKIELMSTRSEDSFELGETSWRYRRVACDQRGLNVAASAESDGLSGKIYEVHVWDALNLTLKARLKIQREADCISMSPDGRMLAALVGTNQIQVFDTVNGTLMEAISAPFAVTLVRCSADSRAVWLSQVDGKLVRQSLKRMETLKVSEGPITCLQLLSQGKTLLTGDEKGKVKLWNVGSTLTLLGQLQGPKAPVLGCDLSNGAKQLLVLFDDPEHTSCVWPAETIGKGNASNPSIQFTSEHRADVGIINDDASRIFIGNEQGEIQAWSGTDGKLLYRFTGHQGPVIGLIANTGFSRLTSGGADRTVRNWTVPGTVNESTPVQQKLEPEGEIRLPEIAAPIDIPLANIAGTIDTAESMNGEKQLDLNTADASANTDDGKVPIDNQLDAELRESLEQLSRAEAALANSTTPEQIKEANVALSEARKNIAITRKEFLGRHGGNKGLNIASDQSNLLLSLRTEFDFKESRFRPCVYVSPQMASCLQLELPILVQISHAPLMRGISGGGIRCDIGKIFLWKCKN